MTAAPPAPTTLPEVRIAALRRGGLVESQAVDELAGLVRARGARVWIDLTAPSPATVHAVAAELGLHPLIAEDIVESNERAKLQLEGEVIHVVLFSLYRDGDVHEEEVDFVLGRGWLLTAHSASWDPNQAHQLRLGVAGLLERGPDFLMWALADAIVDAYFPIFDALGDEIDAAQDAVLAEPTSETLERVFRLKRELIQIRHVLAPSREIFAQLTSRELGQIGDAAVFYYRDVYDHLVRLNDEFESHRELIASTLDVYLSTINNNLTVIMKRLTGVTVILAGVGAIAGLGGMSEAAAALAGKEAPGFYLVVVLTLGLAAAATFVLRRFGWL
jgi:magnesium transporter